MSARRTPTRYPTKTASSVLALMSGACAMPKIVHYHVSVGERVMLPAGSRVIGHAIDYTKGAPRVSLVVLEPGDGPQLAPPYDGECCEAAAPTPNEPIVTIPAGTSVLLDGKPVTIATEVTVPNGALSSDEAIMRYRVPADVSEQWAAEDRARYAAMKCEPLQFNRIKLCREPTPLEPAAKRVRQTTDAFAKASKAVAAAENAFHRAADYRDQCQKVMAHAQEDLTALALKAEG